MKSTKKIISFIFALLFVLSVFPMMAAPSLAESEEFTQEDAASLESAQQKLEEINERQAELSSSIKKYSSQKNSEVKAKQTLEQQITQTEEKISTIEWILDNLELRLEEKNAELEYAQREYDEYYEKYVATSAKTMKWVQLHILKFSLCLKTSPICSPVTTISVI